MLGSTIARERGESLREKSQGEVCVNEGGRAPLSR